jgi:uncharacterized membrane protein YbhN (UPF0104 family)
VPPATLRIPSTGLRSLAAELRPGQTAPEARPRTALALALAAAGLVALLIATHGHELAGAIGRALHTGWSAVVLGALFEAASLAGYVLLLDRVVGRGSAGLRLKDSYDIALGGTAATRLLPTAGAGGVAVAVWALRARGMRPRELTERLLAFVLLLYGVYMSALLASGAAVGLGLVHVNRGQALGLVGMSVAAGVLTTVAVVFAWPAPVRAVLGRVAQSSARFAPAATRASHQLPVLRAALGRAWRELRRPHLALLGAVASWGFDLAVLAGMLHAFGVAIPLEAIVLAYFFGTLFNLIPLPGSLSGGLAGALIALGAPAAPAIAAVLAYRAVAVWLPAASGIASLASLRTSVARWRAEAYTHRRLQAIKTQYDPTELIQANHPIQPAR